MLRGTLVPLFVCAARGVVNATGSGVFWWFGPMVIYALDLVIGDDPTNAPDDALACLEQDR